MLSTTQPHTALDDPVLATERRLETRERLRADLWMVDHNGTTVLRCRCVDASEHGLRLRVPLGYGVAEGQRYELRSHLPGVAPTPGFGIVGQRWATVVRTLIQVGFGEDHLEVGVVLDSNGAGAWPVRAASA